MSNYILDIKNLSAGYVDLPVLHNLEIYASKGEIVALLGANGAGKTTTLKAILGLVNIFSGQIQMTTNLLTKMRTPEIAKAGVSYVPEGRGLFPNLTVEENLLIGSWAKKKSGDGDKYEEAYNLFPKLKERRHQRAETLSGGEQQMLAIARALMTSPRLVLIDEPSMGLAPIIVQAVYEVLKQINSFGTTILLVEQNVNLALEVCDRAYVLERGYVVMQGTRDEVRANKRVIEAYLGVSN